MDRSSTGNGASPRKDYERSSPATIVFGDTTWQDYEVIVPVTIHWVEGRPRSGAGILMRFTGHVVGGHRDFPPSQPKWGYQPFGGIGWLRWMDGGDNPPPVQQFFRGDEDVMENFGPAEITLGETYWMKMRAETLPDSEEGHGVTRYSWKMWEEEAVEPSDWNWQVTQKSEHALRRGGAVLLAHRADVTFGDVSIESLTPQHPQHRMQANANQHPSLLDDFRT